MAERRLRRADLAFALALLALVIISRVPFRSRFLYHWDSVNLANGLAHLDILEEHPQPPGYIVYVWLGRLVSAGLGAPAAGSEVANDALVWISVASSAGAVALLYLFAADLWNRRLGLAAAAMLAASPLFWFYGEIALPHTLDAMLVIAAVWLLARLRRGRAALTPVLTGPWDAAVAIAVLPAVAVLALAGGVRPQTLVFLLPLALWALWPLGWRAILVAAVAGALLCLLWLAPLLASAGGLSPYLTKTSTYLARFEADTSLLRGAGLAGLMRNARKLTIYTAYALIPALPALVALPRILRRPLRAAPLPWTLFALWAAPALLFYALIHMGQQGLVFIYLPVVILIAAWLLDAAAGPRRAAFAAATTAAVVLGVGVFLCAPEYPLGPTGQRLLTRDTIARSDRYYHERLDAVRAGVSPGEVVLVGVNWAHLEYYLPGYALLRMDRGADGRLAPRGWPGPAAPMPTDIQRVTAGRDRVALLFVDPETFPFAPDPATTRRIALPTTGEMLLWVTPLDVLTEPPTPIGIAGGQR